MTSRTRRPGCGVVENDTSEDTAPRTLGLRVALAQPRQCGDRCALASDDVGDGDGRCAAGDQGSVGRLVREVVTGDVCSVSGESDDFDMDESIPFHQAGKPERLSGSRSHSCDEDIRVCSELGQLRDPRLIFEVDRDDLMLRRQFPVVLRNNLSNRIACRRFDLDDPCSESREAGSCEWARQVDRQVDDSDISQWFVVIHWVSSSCMSTLHSSSLNDCTTL